MLALRHLPWFILTAGGVLLGGVWACGSWRTPASRAVASGPDHAHTVHYVSPRQLAASNAMLRHKAGDLQATTHDGRRLGWEELSGGKPVVLIFIKVGCPCNAEVEPFYRRVARLYPSEAQYAAVIDGDAATA